MRAVLLYCMLVLVCSGGRCLAKTFRDGLQKNDPRVLATDPQQLNQRRQQRQFSVEGGAESPKQTAETEEAKEIVDKFLDKIKRRENVNAQPPVAQCGYEVKATFLVIRPRAFL